jgi:hypothetical protein
LASKGNVKLMVTASNYTYTTPPTFAPHIYWHIPMAMKIPHTYPPISHTHCLYRGHRLWWAFLLSSLSVFLAGLLALLLWKVAHRGFNSIGIFRPRRQRWAHRQVRGEGRKIRWRESRG